MRKFFINYVQIGVDGVFSASEAVTADTPEEARKKFRETHSGYVFADIKVVPDVSLNEAEEEDEEEAEEETEDGRNYRDAIVELIDRQRAKGLNKYGQTLEENTTLTSCQRIEHAQEELVDALQYLEHLKQTQADRLTANDYQRAALRTASQENWQKFDGRGPLLDAALGLGGEAGECLDIVKKALFQGHELDREHLIEELGDVAWYLAIFCDALSVSLEEVLQANIAKLRERYPDGFDKARSVNRTEG